MIDWLRGQFAWSYERNGDVVEGEIGCGWLVLTAVMLAALAVWWANRA